MDLKRRSVLMAGGGAVAGAFLGLQRLWAAELPGSTAAMATGFGDLRTDPRGILDLPSGFSYRVIARAGSEMSDGLLVPGMADGMAAFANPGGGVRLVCNHELDPDRARLGGGPFGARHARFGAHHRQRAYDPGGDEPSCGSTTTLIYDPQTGRVARQWLSLTGTERNCAGGPTPWGAWLSCEESLSGIDNLHAREHGYVFEVPASADGLVPALALKSMGRFNHEAAAVDPRTGVVYLSEDRPDSLLYRYLPDQPGRLAAGGRLQALALRDWNAADTRNWTPDAPRMEPGKTFTTRWIDLDDVASADDSLRQRGHASGDMRRARPWSPGAKACGGAMARCTSPAPRAGPVRPDRCFVMCPARMKAARMRPQRRAGSTCSWNHATRSRWPTATTSPSPRGAICCSAKTPTVIAAWSAYAPTAGSIASPTTPTTPPNWPAPASRRTAARCSSTSRPAD